MCNTRFLHISSKEHKWIRHDIKTTMVAIPGPQDLQHVQVLQPKQGELPTKSYHHIVDIVVEIIHHALQFPEGGQEAL